MSKPDIFSVNEFKDTSDHTIKHLADVLKHQSGVFAVYAFKDSDEIDEESEDLEKFSHPLRKKQYFISRALIKRIFSVLLEKEAKSIEFEEQENGKPQLKLQNTKYDFNISHNQNLILIGVAQDQKVGVDVEALQPKSNFLRIAETFSTEAELKSLRDLTENEFYSLWSQKEALIKAHGGSVFKHAKQIEFLWKDQWVLKSTPKGFASPDQISLSSQKFKDKYVVSLALLPNDFRP